MPSDEEYDEVPRGRVVYNQRTRQYTLFADRCILTDQDLVGQIEDWMSLPSNIKVETDPH